MRKIRLISLSMIIGLMLSTFLWIALTSTQAARAAPTGTIRYVLKDGGTDAGDCTDEDNPCRTIQYGINQSSDGDTIRVGYRGPPLSYYENIQIQKSIALEGGWIATGSPGNFTWTRTEPCDPQKTIIDARHTGRPVTINTPAVNPRIECFTITGGRDVPGSSGGGIYSYKVNPIIIHNYIVDNIVSTNPTGINSYGGGIYIEIADSTSVISGNLIQGNWASKAENGFGGGIFLADADTQVINNTILDNQAAVQQGNGGGICVLNGSATMMNNTIERNKAGVTSMSNGGGIYASAHTSPSTIIIQGNTIKDNIALDGAGTKGMGGGIYVNSFDNVTISGNEIGNNYASPNGTEGYGGGIMISETGGNTLITDNHIYENYGAFNQMGYGGGVYVADLPAGDLQDNIIEGNYATWAGTLGVGGGIYLDVASIDVSSNVISGNFGAGFPGFPSTATGFGGGLYITNSHTTMLDNLIYGNTGTNGTSTAIGIGGGIHAFTSTLTLISNTIAYNNAGTDYLTLGGGAYLEMTTVTMERNQILHNQATGSYFSRGGGIRINICPAFTLTNNIVAGNMSEINGSGVAVVFSQGSMYHNTIAENSGGDGEGVLIDRSTVTLANTILVSQTVGISVTAAATASLEATLWGDGAWANNKDWDGAGTILTGTINLWGDPLFINPANDDYHILNTSPAIDAGIDAGVTQDIDGEARPQNSYFDIGADEVFRMLYMYLPIMYR